MTELERETRDASTARVPAVEPGTALVFTRYDQVKSVVLNPEDFERLSALDRALDELAEDRPPISAAAAKAHALESTPGAPIENADQLRALLGL